MWSQKLQAPVGLLALRTQTLHLLELTVDASASLCSHHPHPPPIHCLSPHPVSWGPQLTLYWKEKSLQSIVFHAITRALPHCLCLWAFLFLPFHVYGFPRPPKGKPNHLASGYPLSTCQAFHFSTHPLFFWDTQSSTTLLSFLPFYRNRNLFWLVHPLPSQCSISRQVFQLHGFCLYTLTSFVWFFR